MAVILKNPDYWTKRKTNAVGFQIRVGEGRRRKQFTKKPSGGGIGGGSKEGA